MSAQARCWPRLGLRTVADLASAPLATLERELGKASAAHLSALAWGRDDRQVLTGTHEKSIGAEETFAADIADPDQIRRELLRLSGRTARGLRSSGYAAKTISVKLRRADFKTITRARTLRRADRRRTEDLHHRLRAVTPRPACAGVALRLVGVRATGLSPAVAAGTQLALGERADAWREAEHTMDKITQQVRRQGAVRPGSLIAPATADTSDDRLVTLGCTCTWR